MSRPGSLPPAGFCQNGPAATEAAPLAPMTVKTRYQLIDILRGMAIVLMVWFHFSWDLWHFGYADFDFYRDPFWLNLRTLIVSLFLLLVGVSLVLAARGGMNWPRYFRRLGLLVLFAVAITVVSYFNNPQRVIVFGILHFIAFASVVALPFLRYYWLTLFVGLTLVVLDTQFSHPLFNQPWLHWIGLMTHKPLTEDYVPVIPWLGVVLIGIFIGHSLFRWKALAFAHRWQSTASPARFLALAGRHSLAIYVAHQPLLFGLFALVGALTG